MKWNSTDLTELELRDLVAEFRASPFGRHSPQLQALLDLLRMVHPGGKLILVCTRTCQEWALGCIRGDPPQVTLDESIHFTSLEDAERHVFDLRWRHLTGRELPK